MDVCECELYYSSIKQIILFIFSKSMARLILVDNRTNYNLHKMLHVCVVAETETKARI